MRPRAHCSVTEDGALLVALPVEQLPGKGHELVLQLRDNAEADTAAGCGELRFPLPPHREAADGRHVVRIDVDGERLAEGRWDTYVERADGARRRVRAALVEQAPLVNRPPRTGPGGVSAWIPYITRDGYLAVRSWLRPAHAEVDDRVDVGVYGTTIEATLHGAEFGRSAGGGPAGTAPETAAEPETEPLVEARRRGGGTDRAVFRVPAEPLPDSPGRFAFTLPHDDFAERRGTDPATGGPAERDLWDLWLLTGRPGAAAVRIGRIGGDIVERKKTDIFPIAHREPAAGEDSAPQTLPAPGTRTRIRPYFTVANNLSVTVRTEPAETQTGTGQETEQGPEPEPEDAPEAKLNVPAAPGAPAGTTDGSDGARRDNGAPAPIRAHGTGGAPAAGPRAPEGEPPASAA